MMGMGFSAKPVAYQYSVHDHADMHEALLAHLGIDPGTHHGSRHKGDSVAQELLARHEFGEQSYGAVDLDLDHLAQRRHVHRVLYTSGGAEAVVSNTVGRHPQSCPGHASVPVG